MLNPGAWGGTDSRTQIIRCNTTFVLHACRLFGETIEKLNLDGESVSGMYNIYTLLRIGLMRTIANGES